MLLNVRSEYSLLNSTLRMEDYVKRAKEYGYDAIGIADINVLHGALEFYRLCDKYKIKALIGMTVMTKGIIKDWIDYPFILYAKNITGYQQLLELSKRLSAQESIWKYLSSIETELIIMSAGRQSEIEQALIHDEDTVASQIIEKWKETFGKDNVYLGQAIYPLNPIELERLQVFTQAEDIPMIMGQLVETLDQSDAFSLNVLRAIDQDEKVNISQLDMKGTNYLYPKDVLTNLYEQAGLDEVIENTHKLTMKMDVVIKTQQSFLPKFSLPEGMTSDEYLEKLTTQQLKSLELSQNKTYKERLTHELSVIKKMGFSDYFLIVWDIIAYCHENQIRIGPGRGSAAGSLVSYLLKITLVDPIEYQLLFERFLNPERYTMPDIDIDIPDNQREKVLAYIESRYGHEQVAQIVTFGTFGAKQAIRDTLRVMNASQEELRRWSRSIPTDQNQVMTLKRAFEDSREFQMIVSENEFNQAIYSIANTIEGLPRHTSTHAAAVVINDFPLVEVIPITERVNQMMITQFSMYDVEYMGLLKMDFLGLRNLTILDDILVSIKKNHNIDIDINNIPKDDIKTIQLFQRADTNGVFQFESEGIRRVLMQLRPETFEDIVAVNALYRPGPMQQINHYIKRKHKEEAVDYLHPMIEEILKPTYGIIIYQEQVMQILVQMGGFSMGEADMLRRAMSKKLASVMDQQRDHFVEGAIQKGVAPSKAKEIYEYIYQFSNYGFNRAHAVVYSTLAFQLAYLKSHYSLEFYQAILNNGRSNSTSHVVYFNEAKRQLGKIKGVDINHSLYDYSIYQDQLMVGFGSIKGVRRELINHILNERDLVGPYIDIVDFLRRLEDKHLKEERIEPLIYAGVFDQLGYNRRTLIKNLPDLIQGIKFSGESLSLYEEIKPKVSLYSEFDSVTLAEKEQEVLGFNLMPHPLDEFRELIDRSSELIHLGEVLHIQNRRVIQTIAMIVQVRSHQTRQGQPMAFVKLSDGDVELTLVVFPREFMRMHPLLKENQIIKIKGRIDLDQRGNKQLIAQSIILAKDDEYNQTNYPKNCFIRVSEFKKAYKQIDELKKLCIEEPGPTRIILVNSQKQSYQLDSPYLISFSRKTEEKIKQIFGYQNVIYK